MLSMNKAPLHLVLSVCFYFLENNKTEGLKSRTGKSRTIDDSLVQCQGQTDTDGSLQTVTQIQRHERTILVSRTNNPRYTDEKSIDKDRSIQGHERTNLEICMDYTSITDEQSQIYGRKVYRQGQIILKTRTGKSRIKNGQKGQNHGQTSLQTAT